MATTEEIRAQLAELVNDVAGTPVEDASAREVRARRYRRAFISYSSKDRAEVLKRVQGIAVTRFTSRDVVRHPLVARIVDAYDAQRSRRTSSSDEAL